MEQGLQIASPENSFIGPPQTAIDLRGRRGKAWRRMLALLRKIETHNGNISLACASLGMQRRTYYRWLYGELPLHRRFQRLLAQIKPVERRIDAAEAVIDHHLTEKNLIAAMFTLKSQGKDRGWNEREFIVKTVADVALEIEQLRTKIADRAAEKGVPFQEELRNYLEFFGKTLAPEIGEKLNAELM